MDRCPHCDTRMKPVLGLNGRTEFQCLPCEPVQTLPAESVAWDRHAVPKAA